MTNLIFRILRRKLLDFKRISTQKTAMSEAEELETQETEVDNSATNEKAKPNHIAGCSVFLIILATISFIAIFSTYQYFSYKNAFISISEAERVPTKVLKVSTEDGTLIEKKLNDFSKLVREKKHAQLELSANDINIAIAHFDKLKEFRKTLFVTELTKTHIVCRASFKVKPGFNPERYMNGLVKFKPEIADGSIFPIIEEVKADTNTNDSKKFPEKIKQALSTLMFTEYRNDESIQDVFHKLTTAKLKDGKLTIISDPASDKPLVPHTTESNVLQIFLLLVFIFVTTILFMVWYRKFKRKQKEA